MRECFELAKLAQGKTSPNPLVGCVVIDKYGKTLAKGFHSKYGENHAERDALLKISKESASGSTLFVNLEPCAHFGKTPPCADLIIEYGVSKVVIAMRDVNPLVSGKGITKLKNAGIEVVEDILKDEALKINEIFIKNMTEKKSFVALKTATTLDGKIATRNGSSKWITSASAREEVKKIRARYDAILTSSSTVITDNPTMEHHTKIIIDRELKTDFKDAKIYQNITESSKVYVFHDEKFTPPEQSNIIFIPTTTNQGKIELESVFKKLHELKIMSVLIESGGKLNGSALGFIDKIYQFIAPKLTSDNTAKSCFDGAELFDIQNCHNFRFDSIKTFDPDILLTYYPISKK